MLTPERLETIAREIQTELAAAGHSATIEGVRTLMRLSALRQAYASANPELHKAADACLQSLAGAK